MASQRFPSGRSLRLAPSSEMTYRWIRVAVSSVVPANDAMNTPMMTMPISLGMPTVAIMLADPKTTALIFDPSPSAADQVL